MKKLLIAFLFITSLAGAQELKTELIKKAWANGACCAHGCNYTLTIIPPNGKSDKISFSSICVDANFFSASQVKTKISVKDNSLKITFGWSLDPKAEKLYPEEENKRSSLRTCNENNLTLIINGVKKKVKIKNIKELRVEPWP